MAEERPFPHDISAAELRVITTRALLSGDDFGRSLLREQLLSEEFYQGTRPGRRESDKFAGAG